MSEIRKMAFKTSPATKEICIEKAPVLSHPKAELTVFENIPSKKVKISDHDNDPDLNSESSVSSEGSFSEEDLEPICYDFNTGQWIRNSKDELNFNILFVKGQSIGGSNGNNKGRAKY